MLKLRRKKSSSKSAKLFIKFFCYLNSSKYLIFRVKIAVMMASIGSACQNAENAHFEKRTILGRIFEK